MGIVPDKKPEKVSWYQSKISPWTTSATVGAGKYDLARELPASIVEGVQV